jgi:hypothetical protein
MHRTWSRTPFIDVSANTKAALQAQAIIRQQKVYYMSNDEARIDYLPANVPGMIQAVTLNVAGEDADSGAQHREAHYAIERDTILRHHAGSLNHYLLQRLGVLLSPSSTTAVYTLSGKVLKLFSSIALGFRYFRV